MGLLRVVICAALLSVIPGASIAAEKETVVLLHGIARTKASMKTMEKSLQSAGYETRAITYPSTDRDIDAIAQELREKELSPAFWRGAGKVHFVTHSMGGLVARRYLAHYQAQIPAEKLGRVVMMAPPSRGSHIADLIHNLPPYHWYYGPAGQELTSAARAAADDALYYDAGIIAGGKEWPYFIAALIVPGPSDGRVSVENTKAPGMKDHIVMPATHTFIMDRPDVQRQVVHFIREGIFHHARRS